MMDKIRILNSDFHIIDRKGTVEWAQTLIKENQRGYICTINVAILMMMRENPYLQDFIDKSSLKVADGQPLVWLSRSLKPAIPERVTGVDLVEDLSEMCASEGYKVYFMGATKDIITKVVDYFAGKHVNLNICGYDDGYYTPEESAGRADAIRESGAQLLIVGMGVPRQENFLRDNWDRLGVNLAIPVGGSFDVIAGEKKRAPLWVQKIGFEWLFRLIQEPGRLFKRYFTTNLQFIGLSIKEILFKRKRRKE